MKKSLRTLATAFAIAAASSSIADSPKDPVIFEARANAAQTVLQVFGTNLEGNGPAGNAGP